VSATYNVVHPDKELRRRQTAAAVGLIARVPALGADVVTICTGTRHPDDIWRGHPENAREDAWSELRATLEVLLAAAAAAGVRLGVEPEPGNVVRDARSAARLLDELGPDAPIGIVFDPANLLSPATISEQERILGEAIELLGSCILAVHAKDVVDGGYSAAGTGLLDYPLVFRLLADDASVPVIAQDVCEADARRVHDDLLGWARSRASDAR
jgi:sugar phosphate isomerase/epimerase